MNFPPKCKEILQGKKYQQIKVKTDQRHAVHFIFAKIRFIKLLVMNSVVPEVFELKNIYITVFKLACANFLQL